MKTTKAATNQAPQSESSAEIAAAVREVERAGEAAMMAVESAAAAAKEAGSATKVAGAATMDAAGALVGTAGTVPSVPGETKKDFLATLSVDEAFLGAIGGIAKNTKGSEFLTYEGVLILALWAFRSWKLSKVNTLFRQMFTQAWIAVAYWLVALFAIPGFLWGEQYRVALSHFFRAILRHFLS